MAENSTDGIFNLTKPVTMSFPQLFVAKAFGSKGRESGTPKFSANFLFPADSPDLKDAKALAVKIARAKWPNVDLKELSFPFSSGDKAADKRKAKSGKDDGAFNRGNVIVAARSKYQPRLSVIENGKPLDLEDEALVAKYKSRFYAGVQVLAQLNFVAYDSVGNNKAGVCAYLNLVLSTNKGQKIATGAPSAAEAFKGYIGIVSAEDPTGGAEELVEDNIPY